MDTTTPQITCDFPGGNIVVESIHHDHARIRQDQRGSTERWFYWYFAVLNASGRTMQFTFTDWDVIGSRGPAVSIDGGLTWRWLGRDCVDGPSFRYTFSPDEDETRFAFCIPYTQTHLFDFLADQPAIRSSVFCTTPAGRDVPLLTLGDARASRCLLLTARHHCCEAAASYVLEGVLSRLTEKPLDDVEVAAVPFMDADGVEAGDQGKKRNDFDHNRDYAGPGIYAETRAMRRWFPRWSADRPTIALDLHCPWKSGGWNERLYLVGNRHPHIAAAQAEFVKVLTTHTTGPLRLHPDDYLPFGTDWNASKPDEPLDTHKSFGNWAAEQPNTTLTGSLEIPYANVRDTTVTENNLRYLGQNLAEALRTWMSVPDCDLELKPPVF